MRRTATRGRSTIGLVLRILVTAAVAFYVMVTVGLTMLKWVAPFTTAVQIERRWEAWRASKPYHKAYEWVPLREISPNLQHAVVAAEDARFYQHHGFDWTEVQIAVQDDLDGVRSSSPKQIRGASTITQQLVKNLFLTTSRSWMRKGIEFTIVPIAETVLGKRRILELYLNVIEWGPGIYGAEAAAERYYHEPARRISREQGLALASVVPAPLRRKPGRLTDYENIIASRMMQMGW